MCRSLRLARKWAIVFQTSPFQLFVHPGKFKLQACAREFAGQAAASDAGFQSCIMITPPSFSHFRECTKSLNDWE
jgi:hypothetical protein